MKYLHMLTLVISLFCTTVFADAGKDEITNTGQEWAAAIASRNPTKITALYHKNAFLFATFTNMLDNPTDIKNYFINLTKKEDLKVKFSQQEIRLFGDTAINSGLYEFSFKDNGKTVTIPGRYTFVYKKTPDGWMIIDHHSSILPEG